MSQLGQRIRLIHELRELAASKEVTDYSRQSFGVDQLLRSQLLGLLIKHGHALAHQTLGPGQPHSALIFDQLAHRPNTATAQVVDIVDGPLTPTQADQILNGRDKVFLVQRPAFILRVQVQFLLNLVATHTPQIIAARIKEQALKQLARVGGCRRIAGTQLVINILQCVIGVVRGIFAHAFKQQSVVPRDVYHLKFFNTGRVELLQQVLRYRFKFRHQNALAVRVYHVGLDHTVFKLLRLGLRHLDGFKRVE